MARTSRRRRAGSAGNARRSSRPAPRPPIAESAPAAAALATSSVADSRFIGGIRLLIVDRDPRVATSCAAALADRGFIVESVDSFAAALATLERKGFDLALVELSLPDGTGFELLREMRRIAPATIPIAMSTYATVRNAVEAVKRGAYDYLVKPFSDDVLSESLADALEKRAFFGGARTGPMDEFHGMVGRSRAMLELRQWVNKTAPSHASVLLLGELGTGKELVARILHERSPRAGGPFVAARCGGADAQRILGEWLGYLGGGAVTPGAFEMASGGTLYLRDVADLAPDLQDALFTALSTRRFTPVGGTDAHRLNVRVIAATDRNLATLVADRRFRQDLFYLIASHTVSCPSLRDRREDIPLLVDYFLTRFCRQSRHRALRVTPGALDLLVEHTWPGNVRELECVVEDAALRAPREVVDVSELRFLDLNPVTSPVPLTAEDLKQRLKALRAEAVVELERLFVVRALERHRGNVSRAAREVGMQRPNFQALMRRHRVRSGDYAAGGPPEDGEGEPEAGDEAKGAED